MKRIALLTSVLMCMVFSMITQQAKATHVSGADISYQCLGNNQFQVTLNLFRDCTGITLGTSQTVTLTSTCGGSTVATLNIVPDPDTGLNWTDISQLCSNDSLNSTCYNGTLPGMERYTYTGVVTMAPPCNTWTVAWDVCCRNTTVNVPTSGSSDIYVDATMNSMTNACNNSPVFSGQPIPYVCVNQPVSYSYGVYEVDGDSLVFSLIPGRETQTTQLVYAAGYSGASPIPGIAIDPNTGLLTFTPTVLGNFIVVVAVTEYDDNGNVLSTTMRDIQFIVQNCNNTVGAVGPFDTVSGQASQLGPLALELCGGTSTCFSLTFADPDVNDTLNISTNLQTVLPGATMTMTGTNPLTVDVCWTAPGTMPSLNLVSFQADDGACPVAGIFGTTVEIHFIQPTFVGPDQTICEGDSVMVIAEGGTVFDWTSLSGDPITVGTNFSCTPCDTVWAVPSQTTTYMVDSDLQSGCTDKDTITINVAPSFTISFTQDNQDPCIGEDVQVTTTVTPSNPNYTYQWIPVNPNDSLPLSSNSVSDPTIITGFNFGTYEWTVIVSNPEGCVKTETFSVDIVQGFPPSISISGDTAVCPGDSILLTVTEAGSNPNMSYTWSPSPPLTSTTGNQVWAVPTGTQDIYVTGVDNSGCDDTDTFTISTDPVPNFSITADPNNGLSPLLVCFYANDPNLTNQQWVFGDSTLVNGGDTVCHTFYQGTYLNQLYAENQYGCGAYAFVTVIVDTFVPSSFMVPNVFSPNGDGYNDIFRPVMEGNIVEFSGQVYNRWGKKVYEWTDPNGGWDGGDNSDGTYYYLIRAVADNGNEYNDEGTLTLVRK